MPISTRIRLVPLVTMVLGLTAVQSQAARAGNVGRDCGGTTAPDCVGAVTDFIVGDSMGGGTAAPLLTSLSAHEYTVRTVYATLGQCDRMAAALGEKFATLTSYEVVTAACVPVIDASNPTAKLQSADLVVSYLSVDTAAVHTYVFGQGAVGVDSYANQGLLPGTGAYLTAAECQADLPAKVAEMERETQLQLLDAVCANATVFGVGMRLDGIGEPVKEFDILEVDTYGEPDQDFVEHLKAAVSKHPGMTVSAALLTMPSIDVYYYAPLHPLEFNLDVRVIGGMGGAVMSLADCQAQAQMTMAALQADGQTTSYFQCLKDSYRSGVPVFAANLIVEGQSLDVVLQQFDGPQYQTFNACSQDRTRVMDLYRAEGVADSVGAICGITDVSMQQSYRMTLYKLADKR